MRFTDCSLCFFSKIQLCKKQLEINIDNKNNFYTKKILHKFKAILLKDLNNIQGGTKENSGKTGDHNIFQGA